MFRSPCAGGVWFRIPRAGALARALRSAVAQEEADAQREWARVRKTDKRRWLKQWKKFGDWVRGPLTLQST
eukprot:6638075-Pyramimonas_sp.AAC.1